MGRIFFFMEESEQCELLKGFEKIYDIVYHGSYHECIQSEPVPLYKRKGVWYNSVTELKLAPTMGSHIYKSYLIMHKCDYESYIIIHKPDHIARDGLEGISYSPSGIWQGKYIIHGEFNVDNNNVKMREQFTKLRKMIREMSAKQVEGYYIGKEAYKNKDKYERFITIDVGSPKECDVTVD